MPEADLDAIADELYGVRPDEFVAERDAAVARARESGDRELAKAVGRLRRPTRAAWLANLLARQRGEQLDGLLGLAGGLVDAQRTLDGTALRELSARRHQLVAAMAREAGRLARAEHEAVGDGLLRELQSILEAALADPAVADEVRSGRLVRTVSYAGFGPDTSPGTAPASAGPSSGSGSGRAGTAAGAGADAGGDAAADRDADGAADGAADPERAERERAERARAERERAERDRRERAVAEAEAVEAEAVERQRADEAARDEAAAARDEARDRVAGLMTELDAAREVERAATTAAREAEATARASARAAGAAAGHTARARARLDAG